MEKLDDEGQWIVMMGFLVAVSIFFLALIINQATLVGQTTAEGVLEFPKSEIRDLQSEVYSVVESGNSPALRADIRALELARKNALVNYSMTDEVKSGITYHKTSIHFNNGVTVYDETVYL
jgi:predicted RecA/RadA family phage recombinase